MYLVCFRFKLQNNVVYLQSKSTGNGRRTTDDRQRSTDVVIRQWTDRLR